MFCIIGTQNAITYKEVFPYLRDNRVWLGNGFNNGNAYFKLPKEVKTEYAEGVFDTSTGLVKFRNCCWFTNIEHGRRHRPMELMSMADNLKFSKHKNIRTDGYLSYENYDALEIPFTDAIPGDYEGKMGVPQSFLEKYCPEQFEIIGIGSGYLGQSIGVGPINPEHKKQMVGHSAAGDLYYLLPDGKPKVPYCRIIIQRRSSQ